MKTKSYRIETFTGFKTILVQMKFGNDNKKYQEIAT